jgi:hypothetical protein
LTVIGWTVINGEGLVWEEPEMLSVYMNNEYKQSKVKSCWASNDLLKKTFVIKSPFDIHLSYNSGKVILEKDSSISHLLFERIFVNSPEEYTQYPVIQMGTRYVFICDKSCTITLTPPFHNTKYDDYESNTRVFSGMFNIYDWQRPLSYGIEWLDVKKDLFIKKGQPLFYVTFNTEKLDDDFKLKYLDTSAFYKLIDKCTNARACFKSKTKDLIYRNRHQRKDNVVESKCPFSKMSRKIMSKINHE